MDNIDDLKFEVKLSLTLYENKEKSIHRINKIWCDGQWVRRESGEIINEPIIIRRKDEKSR